MTVEKLSTAGQVLFNKVDIVSKDGKIYDIRNMPIQITIYEDMFSPFMTGNIVIEDALDLIYNIPLVGEELLDIEFKSPTMPSDSVIKKRFYIYKLTDVDFHHDNTIGYVLHFISWEAIADNVKKISRRFSGRISTNVHSFIGQGKFLESSKKFAVEETSNSLTYVSNFWTPIENINYLTQRALTTEGNTPSFVFFESNKNFVFASLQKLVRQTPFLTYSYSKKTRAASVAGSVLDLEAQMSKVLDMRIKKQFDILERNTGMYSGILHTHNILTKSIKTTTFDYFKSWKKEDHLAKFPLNSPKIITSKLSGIAFRTNTHFTHDGQISDKFQLWLLERRSILKQINSIILEIEVHGRTDLEVGKVINLDVPINQIMNPSDSKTDVKNKKMNGKFLITAIHHRFYHGMHKMHLEVVKDSFGDEIK